MRRILRLFPDYGADPVWDLQGEVDLDGFDVSDRLRKDLREWARAWEGLMGKDFRLKEGDVHVDWRRRGRRLARDLARELGPETEVLFEA